ncbi:hypothetical protein DUNSADRAFT_7874 [Dunaliella salina]|uniref:Encoded protein n=1 Tax=Dunaliella salina TaxID=3046 RepID=A0ABQ7GKK8_DUNSA|nr:hypothetical protein DUNSADRAFT_7874 [Dunaliella salina]|eukprot:KAF5835114.1 hypothetical protein DUNSADRAFT_7874 [Dunaliella salina]
MSSTLNGASEESWNKRKLLLPQMPASCSSNLNVPCLRTCIWFWVGPIAAPRLLCMWAGTNCPFVVLFALDAREGSAPQDFEPNAWLHISLPNMGTHCLVRMVIVCAWDNFPRSSWAASASPITSRPLS